MTEPRRLLHSTDPLVRELLDAGRHERPSAAALQRTIVAASAGATVLGAAQALASAKTSALTTKGLVVSQLAKWVGICTVGGVVGLGVVSQVVPERTSPDVTAAGPKPRRPKAAVAAPAGAAAAIADTNGPAPTPTSAASAAPEVLVPDSLARDGSSVSANAPDALASRRAKAASARSPADEIRLIDAARLALRRGEPGAALSILKQHAAEYRSGMFVPEAQYLRMEALWAMGAKPAARKVAEQLLKRSQGGLHRTRALQVLASGAVE